MSERLQGRIFWQRCLVTALGMLMLGMMGSSCNGCGGSGSKPPPPPKQPTPTATPTTIPTTVPTATPTASASATATATPTATPTPPPPSACLPSSSLGVLVQGKNVTSYVPNGNWENSVTGVALVQIEGTGITPTLIPTANPVNSCSSNSGTGQTVCVANNTDVYLINGPTLTSTLTSGGSGFAGFSGGDCTNCGVTFNATTNQAAISMSTASGPGFQFLDFSGATPTFEAPFASPAHDVTEDIAIDPTRNFLLSPSEDNDYEIVNITSTTAPAFFENSPTGIIGEFDSAAEDCSTGIALSSEEGTENLFIADLTQATFTPGSPDGTWTAPSQSVDFPEFTTFGAGTCGIAVAGPTHIAIATGEFGGNGFGAVQLPSTSGSGTPSFPDYVECTLPNTPDGVAWSQGDDPHTVTAYVSPNSGDAIALLANLEFNSVTDVEGPTYIAVVDLTKMLNQTIVPRITNGEPTAHTCDPTVSLQSAGVLTYVAVP